MKNIDKKNSENIKSLTIPFIENYKNMLKKVQIRILKYKDTPKAE